MPCKASAPHSLAFQVSLLSCEAPMPLAQPGAMTEALHPQPRTTTLSLGTFDDAASVLPRSYHLIGSRTPPRRSTAL